MPALAVLILYGQISLLPGTRERMKKRRELEHCYIAISQAAEAMNIVGQRDGEGAKSASCPETADLPQFDRACRYALVYGPAGSGKTELLRLFLRREAETSPNACFWCAAIQPSAFSEESERMNRYFTLDGSRETLSSLLRAVNEELRARQNRMERVHAESYEDYERAAETSLAGYRRLPKLYVLIDDLDLALASDTDGGLCWQLQQMLLFAQHFGVWFLYTETKNTQGLTLACNKLPERPTFRPTSEKSDHSA